MIAHSDHFLMRLLASGSDSFTFPTMFSEDIEDGSFDSFGDFGDFQTAQDGELTPTTGSWSFTSDSNASDGASLEDSPGSDGSSADRTESVGKKQKR
jgi:serine/threonine-protein phosphatase 6 regulatory subunit 3